MGPSAASRTDDTSASKRSLERAAFTTLAALLLAPVVAQGLWRPLAHGFGLSGSAGAVTTGTLTISGAMVLVHWLGPKHAVARSLATGFLLSLVATFGLSLGVAGLLTQLSVTLATALLLRRLPPTLPRSLDGLARRHRALTALYLVGALAAVVSTARLSVFIGDPTRVDLQALPGMAFVETHSCLTAYVHADELSRQRVANLYEERHWHGAHGLPAAPAGVKCPYHPFLLDYYAYPPPFLLIMAPLAPLAGDFLAQRALWFGLNGLVLALGLLILARWSDGAEGHRVHLLAPLFFGSLPVLVTLQIGNFQIAVVVLSVLAMVALERGRPLLGGALLALTILSKLSPGVLGVFLLVQRRWRDAACTAGFGVLFLLLSVVVVGVDPLRAFLTYALARISSGRAFAFLAETPFNILTNMGPFGAPFKLPLLGLSVGDPWTVARHLGRAYTLVLVLLAVVAGRQQGDQRARALRWMALLVLAALQAPFAPGYVTIGLLWALTLLAGEARGMRDAVGLVLLWLLLTVVLPTKSLPALAAFSLLQSSLTIGVPIWLIMRTRA